MNLIYKILGLGKSTKRGQQRATVSQDPRVEQYLSQASNSFQRGDSEAALKYCDLVLGLEPANVSAYRIRGAIRYDLQDSAGAESDLRHALALG